MGFMDSYKHLEKLCGEMFGCMHGVSVYIEEMQNTPRGAYVADGWNEDLKRLKHYRYIRNKIVHDTGCTERNMCTAEDVRWLDGFCGRIVKKKDPLSLYNKAGRKKASKARRVSSHASSKRSRTQQAKKSRFGRLFIFILIIAVVFALILSWKFGLISWKTPAFVAFCFDTVLGGFFGTCRRI